MNKVLTDADIQSLQMIVGEDNVSLRGADLEAHSVDESWADPHLPDVVVWPSSSDEVAAILAYANERDLPVVPWSGGSSLEGNPIPVHGGILLAMYRMNQVLEIREEDLQVIVQPGVIYDDLNKQLRRLGMFFPPAPGSSDVATIGGMVANNSSGMRAVKYGVTRDYVLKLKVVLPDGRILTVGSNAKKSTSGYDLKSLFIGSEGTLGVVTEITLRLMGFPETVAAVVAVYDQIGDAANTVYEAIRFGLDPSAIEILDAATVHVTNLQQGLSLRESPTLFVEFHGSEAGVEEQIEYLRELCEENHCTDIQVAITPEERERLWAARSEAHDSIKFSHPGAMMIAGDVCLPISKFVDMVEFVGDVARKAGLQIYAFGHAGDGNLHTETIARRDDPDEFARGIEATNQIIEHALALGGTTAGEHGVGLLKRDFMEREHGPALALMRAIKGIIDPRGIMNPGKIFPATAPIEEPA
ncbi:MAG: FAD-binding oxidoreductase [Anaerolineae bacterium]|nr:FAD-binding oxidoreductase [Anaerolineae bacterium]